VVAESKVFSGARFYPANKVSNKEQRLGAHSQKYQESGAFLG